MSSSMLPPSPPHLSASPVPLSPASSSGPQQNGAMQSAPTDPSSGPVRRKTSRRANTAERRATHNAVERARRETLNGRFLDLAALLPNLAAVRRPSKSAIVNSSIALIHTQRRARALAGREVRMLKSETDALRRELNEWRNRAGLQHVDEPARSAEFLTLLTLEEASVAEEEEIRRAYEMASIPLGDEDDDGYDAPGYPEQGVVVSSHGMAPPQQMAPHHQIHIPSHHGGHGMPSMHAHEIQAQLHAAALMQQQQQQSRPSVHIPAFDGPSIFPGPGHHGHHGQHNVQTPISATGTQGLMAGNMFQFNNSNSNSGSVSGSPPNSAHGFAPAQSYTRGPAPGQFAHTVTRDDDSASSSSGSGSPPASAPQHFESQQPQQQVPSLAAGATPADFARFWAPQTGSNGSKMGGYPMGFAM